MIKKIAIHPMVFLFSLLPISLWAEAPVSDAIPAPDANSGYHNNYSNSSPTSNYAETPLSQDVPLSQENATYNLGNNYSASNSSSTSLLSKYNELQKEVQRLRGQLEVQSHELTKLKEQQQAYYADLDQRIIMLSSGKGKVSALSLDDTKNIPVTTNTSTNTKTLQTVLMLEKTTNTDEEASYNAAYALIEQKKFTEALISMRAFTKNYPHGKYASNAHYWTGELLLAQHQDAQAAKEFNTVINKYPTSNKISASMLKLGFAYVNLGDTEKAKKIFISVENMFPNTTTAQLAHARLASLN